MKESSSKKFLQERCISINRDKVQVHVVVDPVLSKILRPHQREVIQRNLFVHEEEHHCSILGCEISL